MNAHSPLGDRLRTPRRRWQVDVVCAPESRCAWYLARADSPLDPSRLAQRSRIRQARFRRQRALAASPRCSSWPRSPRPELPAETQRTSAPHQTV